MSASPLHSQNLLGLFELDAAGKVLYARSEPDGNAGGGGESVTGRNFFDEVASFDNAAEFRHRVGSFTRSQSQAGNFNFTCQFGSGSLPVRVLLARISERSNGDQTNSILVHIRKA